MKDLHTSYHTIVQLPAAELGGTKLPGILVDEPDQPLLVEAWKHLTCSEYARMSPSWRTKAVWTIGRFYDWFRVQGGHSAQTNGHQDGQVSHSPSVVSSSHPATSSQTNMSGNRLVDGFLRALEFGTIQQDGSDPTGLRWEPATPQMRNHARIHLRAFLQKLPDHVGNNGLSASQFASETTRGFDMNHSMLFHLSKNKRERTGSRGTLTPTRTAKAFPSSLLPALIWEGCKRERPISDLRVDGEDTLASVYNLPLMMAIVLMAGGGLRYSELFHLFLDDVNDTEVRLYDPSNGVVHRKGRTTYTRKQFLRDVYGMAPRHLASGQLHAGWKHFLITNTTDVFSRVHFLPGWGELFMAIFQAYRKQLYPALPKHPYLFLSIDSGKYGEPWTIGSFRKSYQRALGRIGLTQDSALGTNPHGLRHRYGQTLVDLGMSPLHIQVCMHHISLESQLVYTQPSDTKVNKAMQEVAQRIHAGEIPPSTLTPQQALGYSYRSDPAGLFSSMRLGEGRDRV
jgi:Phage integrase family